MSYEYLVIVVVALRGISVYLTINALMRGSVSVSAELCVQQDAGFADKHEIFRSSCQSAHIFITVIKFVSIDAIINLTDKLYLSNEMKLNICIWHSRKRSVDKINAFIKILIYSAAPLRSIGAQPITCIRTNISETQARTFNEDDARTRTHTHTKARILHSCMDSPLLRAG